MHPFSFVILVGTDHHAFQRAVDWADRRAASRPEDKIFIQYGRSAAPATADGAAFLSPAEMREAVAGADVVITHGGPGTISDARSGGHRPIVFPRDPALGEHVDDHQQRFAAWCDRRGLVRFAKTTDDLDAMVAALPSSGTREERTDHSASAEAIAAVGALLDAPLPRRAVSPGAIPVLVLSGDQADVAAAAAATAALAGVVTLGAVGSVPRDGLSRNWTCGCGRPFGDCGWWQALGRDAFGGWHDPSVARLREPLEPRRGFALRRSLDRIEALDRSAAYYSLYDAARRLTGAALLVDTTPGVAEMLSHDHRIDVRALHFGDPAPHSLRRRLPVVSTDIADFQDRPLRPLGELFGAPLVAALRESGAGEGSHLGHSGDVRLRRH